MQVVQEFEPVMAHDVRFLHHRGSDGPALDRVQPLWIFVESHDWDFAGEIEAVQRVRCSATSGPGVSGLKAGDEVYDVTTPEFCGAYTEYAPPERPASNENGVSVTIPL
jgi:hypothetical protein